MSLHPTYVGPKVQVQPAELARYDALGKYAAEAKLDGHWCEVKTNDAGVVSSLTGRSGNVFSGDKVAGLLGLLVGLPNTCIVGELEAGTEAATQRTPDGKHRFYAFDVVTLFGNDTRRLPYEKRRELLELAVTGKSQQFTIVPRVTSSFVKFYDDIEASGGEGIVLKKLGRPYGTGKTDDWVRCKRHRFVDYVVTGVGTSEGGSPNLQVGLFHADGKLRRVATVKNLPKHIVPSSLVGKVIECKGAEVHASGALRHGHYERTRDDKRPNECTLEAARFA